MIDTIVQEIRDIRASRAQAFDCDLNRIMRDAIARDSSKREKGDASSLGTHAPAQAAKTRATTN